MDTTLTSFGRDSFVKDHSEHMTSRDVSSGREIADSDADEDMEDITTGNNPSAMRSTPWTPQPMPRSGEYLHCDPCL
jgi:hypothetical protein